MANSKDLDIRNVQAEWDERMATPLTDAIKAEWVAGKLPVEALFGELRDLERELKQTKKSLDRLVRAVDTEGIAVGDDGYCKNWRAAKLEEENAVLRTSLEELVAWVQPGPLKGSLTERLVRAQSALNKDN